MAVSACAVVNTGARAESGSTLLACFASQDGRRIPLRLEIARTDEERQRGLMDRSELAAGTGMLFTYDELRPPTHAFWMYHTRIPLDIAYLDSSDRIANIVSMKPCLSDSPARCPSYPAGVTFLSALEVNQGFFNRHGLGKGDQLLVGPASGCNAVTSDTLAGQDTD